MYGSKSSAGLTVIATISGGQLISSSEPRSAPVFSTSTTTGPGGTTANEGVKRCPSYLTRSNVGVVVGSPATGTTSPACVWTFTPANAPGPTSARIVVVVPAGRKERPRTNPFRTSRNRTG